MVMNSSWSLASPPLIISTSLSPARSRHEELPEHYAKSFAQQVAVLGEPRSWASGYQPFHVVVLDVAEYHWLNLPPNVQQFHNSPWGKGPYLGLPTSTKLATRNHGSPHPSQGRRRRAVFPWERLGAAGHEHMPLLAIKDTLNAIVAAKRIAFIHLSFFSIL